MIRVIPTVALCVLLASAVGCKSTALKKKGGPGTGVLSKVFKKKASANTEEDATSSSRPTQTDLPIGMVHLVPSGEDFVLIRSSKALNLPPKTELATYNLSGKPTSKLVLSGERQGAFFVADIKQGSPGRTDRVVALNVADPRSSSPAGPAQPGNEPVQVLE